MRKHFIYFIHRGVNNNLHIIKRCLHCNLILFFILSIEHENLTRAIYNFSDCYSLPLKESLIL